MSREMGLSGKEDSDERASQSLVEGLERLNGELGIPRLSECVKQTQSDFESHLSKMADDALASGSPQNNPVVPTAGQIIDLYRSAW